MDSEIQKKNRLMLADYLETKVDDSEYNQECYWKRGQGCALGHAAKSGLFGFSEANGSLFVGDRAVVGYNIASELFGYGSYNHIFQSNKTFGRLDAIHALRNY